MAYSLEIYRHEYYDGGSDMMYRITNPANEGLSTYEVERGDFDVAYFADTLTEYPQIDYVFYRSISAFDGGYNSDSWQAIRRICRERHIDFRGLDG